MCSGCCCDGCLPGDCGCDGVAEFFTCGACGDCNDLSCGTFRLSLLRSFSSHCVYHVLYHGNVMTTPPRLMKTSFVLFLSVLPKCSHGQGLVDIVS